MTFNDAINIELLDRFLTNLKNLFARKTEVPAASNTTPNMDGTAAIGNSAAYARADHRHPTDSTRAPLASPSFTGTPTAPTAASGTNTTQIATTAFVSEIVANRYDRLISMGENLVINGNGYMGDNTNFSFFSFDPSVANGSFGSFSTSTKGSPTSNFYFPIDPTQKYLCSFDGKSANGLGTFYFMLVFKDIDGANVSPNEHMYNPISSTILTQDLKAGDTVLYAEDLSGWGDTSVATSVNNRVNIWYYKNSKGYRYPAFTYTRYYAAYSSANSVDKENNTITLSSAWNKETIPAGTHISQQISAGTYKYIGKSGTALPTEWETRFGYYDGTDYSGRNLPNKFPPGTAYASVGFLTNYNSADDTQWITNISVTAKAAARVADSVLFPNFDYLTLVNTVEYDITSSTNYYKIFSRINNRVQDVKDVKEEIYVRITMTGSSVYSVTNLFVKESGALLPPFVCGYNLYGIEGATSSGIDNIRLTYPKVLNSGYGWEFEFNCADTSQRHVKIEYFAVPNNLTVYSRVYSTYNATHQNIISKSIKSVFGFFSFGLASDSEGIVYVGDDDGQGVIAEGGDVNVIETVKVNGTALTPDANKAVNVVVPTSLSGLASDTTHRTVSDTEKSTWSGKQDALVSGTNIKTINNESILGSGNITIQGGSGGSGDENVIEIVKVNGTALTPDANKAVDVTVPTESTVSGWGFTKNAGTITGITMNGASKGTSGVVNLGTVLTSHQDISGKVGSTTVHTIVSLTETEYIALSTKDSSTLYIITS